MQTKKLIDKKTKTIFTVDYFQGESSRQQETLTEMGVDLIVTKYGKYGPIKVTKTTTEEGYVN